MIALIDYGAGNIRSVEKALRAVGAVVQRVSEPDGLIGMRAAVFPGVGAFDDCLNALDKQHLRTAIREWIAAGKPFLGICVGYQALFERSEEFNSCALGLEVFRGPVVRFQPPAEEPHLKVPQIGWNQVTFTRPDCPLFEGIPTASHFYFVHSYFPDPADASLVAGETDYGCRFASVIWRDNIFATQFHPEKSQAVGLKLLSNFVNHATANGEG